MSSLHPRFDELNDLLDQRVSANDRRRIEQHLADCELCRAEWARLTATRETLQRYVVPTEEVPESLRTAITSALDREARSRTRWAAVTRFAVGLAAAAVIVWGVVVIQRGKTDLPAAARYDYSSVVSGELSLELVTNSASELEQWFNQRLDFPSRVFDLGMMRYHLVGGRVDSIGTRRSALFVYRHERGDLVVCEMFLGHTEELPEGAELRVHEDIEFHIYERAGTTAVFWQEGAVVCVLVGGLPREEILSLAFAKAMKPPTPST